jgi:catechol 2,3-dioxygenase-like lactoylglutathione lyase family enzyme
MSCTIQGINHLAFECKNLEKSSYLFKYVLGAVELKSTPSEIFLKLANFWIVLIQGESSVKSYNHFAFQVDTHDLTEFEEKIRSLELTTLPGKARAVGKNHSLYFYDYDNHLFELHTDDLQVTLGDGIN